MIEFVAANNRSPLFVVMRHYYRLYLRDNGNVCLYQISSKRMRAALKTALASWAPSINVIIIIVVVISGN